MIPEGPYFMHKLAGQDQWRHAPETLIQARDFMEHTATTYAECSGISIGGLTVLGWVVTGSKKVRH
jgi:hypothetical protein